MATGSIQIAFFISCMFLAVVFLVGVFTLFVQSENIERNVLVGGLTLCTAIVGAIMLDHAYQSNFPYGIGRLFGICVFSTLGFLGGRMYDVFRGPLPFLEAPLDADLAE